MLNSSDSSSIISTDLKIERNPKKAAKWELDYKRKRRGSLNDKEVDDELWEDNKE